MQREIASPRATPQLVDILIVENDLDTRKIFADVFEANRCLVRGAANVREAEAALRHRVPDVILCDLHLGDGEPGWKLAQRMREEPRTKHVARIAITGHGHPKLDVVRLFDAYLRKPLNLSALLQVVSELAVSSRKASIA